MRRTANLKNPWMPEKDIEERAETLIKQYSQEIKPIKSPPIPVDNLVERLLNYQLCYENLDDDILGCLCIKENLVVINKQANDVRFTFTCAHEIGHDVLVKENQKLQIKLPYLPMVNKATLREYMDVTFENTFTYCEDIVAMLLNMKCDEKIQIVLLPENLRPKHRNFRYVVDLKPEYKKRLLKENKEKK